MFGRGEKWKERKGGRKKWKESGKKKNGLFGTREKRREKKSGREKKLVGLQKNKLSKMTRKMDGKP